MFIFDADTHLTLTEKPSQTAEELIQTMDKAGIDKSLIWLQPPYMRAIENANKYIHDSACRYPDRLVPFGWVDPHFGIDACMEMLRVCLDEYHMKGIKLNGAQNLFFIDKPELDVIYSELENRQAILAFHVGADYYEFTHPYRVGKIAAKHPELKLLLAHMGGAGLPDLSAACIEMAKEHPNVTLIGSALNYRKILIGLQELGSERICFGSDAPFALQRVELAAYQAMLSEGFTDKERANVLGGNLARLLNIQIS